MSAALLPIYLTAAALLVQSAVAKLARPEPAAVALAELGVPRARLLVRAASLVELAVAAGMAVSPSVGGPAGAVLYLGFGGLVAAQLLRGSVRSCGCLGGAELPPSVAHLALNLVLAGVCAVAHPAPLRLLEQHPVGGTVVWIAAVASAFGVAAALELAPRALTAYRRPTS